VLFHSGTRLSQQCHILSTCPRLPARNVTKHPWFRFLAATLWLRVCHSPVSVLKNRASGGRFGSYHLVLHIADWLLFSASRALYAALWMARFIQLEPDFTRAWQDAPLCFPHGIRQRLQILQDLLLGVGVSLNSSCPICPLRFCTLHDTPQPPLMTRSACRALFQAQHVMVSQGDRSSQRSAINVASDAIAAWPACLALPCLLTQHKAAAE
jgi:hypothetical protein